MRMASPGGELIEGEFILGVGGEVECLTFSPYLLA